MGVRPKSLVTTIERYNLSQSDPKLEELILNPHQKKKFFDCMKTHVSIHLA
jgi:hypothetical protein